LDTGEGNHWGEKKKKGGQKNLRGKKGGNRVDGPPGTKFWIPRTSRGEHWGKNGKKTPSGQKHFGKSLEKSGGGERRVQPQKGKKKLPWLKKKKPAKISYDRPCGRRTSFQADKRGHGGKRTAKRPPAGEQLGKTKPRNGQGQTALKTLSCTKRTTKKWGKKRRRAGKKTSHKWPFQFNPLRPNR